MPFNPLTISGCVLWLKGDSGVFKDNGVTLAANGDGVWRWNDQSGAGNNANAGGATAGQYTTGIGPSLLPVVDIKNSGTFSDGFETSILTLAAPYTVFMAFRPHSDQTSGDHRYMNGSNNWLIGPRSGKWTQFSVSGFVADGSTGPAVDSTVFVRCYLTNNSSASHFVVNGTDISTGTGNVGAPGGVQIDSNRSELANAYYGEILIYNSALGSTDLASVDGYLQRWQNAPAPAGVFKLAGRGGLVMPATAGASGGLAGYSGTGGTAATSSGGGGPGAF